MAPNAAISPVVLVILDGWGYRPEAQGNAITVAKTPVMDSLWETYPHSLIQASGKDVGLPEGQMGNSEVGHLNIGAGRIVAQELVRISDAVEDGSLLNNQPLVDLCRKVRDRNGKLHLIGLCSEGGVHSHVEHLFGLLSLAKTEGMSDICIHAITDGRDTKPSSAAEPLQKMVDFTEKLGVGRIVTLSGRYFAMDRDRRWERTQSAYEVMVSGDEGTGQTALELLQQSYDEKVTDEFIKPTRLAPGAIEAGDGVIVFNFRPDRARQITAAIAAPEFDGFEREPIKNLEVVTLTQYDERLPVTVAFKPQTYDNILGEVVSNHGLNQFRASETEKYPHVTYFFDGGIEKQFPGQDQVMVQSPHVSTYDHAPAMSADELTGVVTGAVRKGIYSMIVVNYANPDMVGHTGNMEATVEAIQTIDGCLGKLLGEISKAGGTALITADHGNAEYMHDEEGNPWTAHTSNAVPLILVEGEGRKIPGHGAQVKLRQEGRLSDLAPTILQILGLPQPKEMTGQSMIAMAEFELQAEREPVKLSI